MWFSGLDCLGKCGGGGGVGADVPDLPSTPPAQLNAISCCSLEPLVEVQCFDRLLEAVRVPSLLVQCARLVKILHGFRPVW